MVRIKEEVIIMQLILTDGTVLEPIIVTGEKKTVQGKLDI